MAKGLIEKKEDLKRVKTYIQGMDESMGGGIPEGSITLVTGTAGTMKSSLCFNILYNEVLNNGKIGLYITLEQSYISLLNQMINMNFDFSKIEVVIIGSDISEMKKKIQQIKESKKGTLIISDIGTLRKEVKDTRISSGGSWWNLIKNIIKRLKEECGLDLFVLDSLNALYVLSDFKNVRNELFYMFEFFRSLDVTIFLISEMPLDRSKYSMYEVEDFLADGVIMLRLIERYRKVTREISIVKMRATDCNIDIFTLEYDGRTFKALYGGKPPLV
jgi:circadian clock protein KaiC